MVRRFNGSLLLGKRWLGVGSFALLIACDTGPQAVGGEILATIGEQTITERDVAAQRAYISEFGELSLGEDGPSKAMLARALVEATIMAEAADREGLRRDPRFAWAMREEDARLEIARYASLHGERRDGPEYEAALRQWYGAHQDEFMEPETRSFEAVEVSSLKEAAMALQRLAEDSEATLGDLGDVIVTRPVARDDTAYPTVHPFLFAPGLGEGDIIPTPLLSGKTILVGRVLTVTPSRPLRLEDPTSRPMIAAAFDAARTEELVVDYVERLRAAKAAKGR